MQDLSQDEIQKQNLAALVKPRQGIQVIARAANILRALENEHDGLSLSDIAKRVSLPRSTVQRIVNALLDEQFLIAATRSARVKLGPAILRLAANTSFDFATVVRPHIENLSSKINETVDLSMQRGDQMIFIDQVKVSHRLSAISEIGESLPMFSAANGKAALSLLTNQEITDLLEDGLFKETTNTVDSIAKLLEQVDKIRITKIAIDDQEHAEGICAIGTAFCDPLGRIYAASIPVPAVRFYRLRDRLYEAVREFRGNLIDSTKIDHTGC